MISLTVIYPNEAGGWFDFDYYVNTHIPFDIGLLPPLTAPLPPGTPRSEAIRGIPGPDGAPPPYLCIGRLWVNGVDDFRFLTENPAAAADLRKYTNVTPVVFFGEPCG